MRILFVSNLYPPFSQGGYEQACFDVAQGLRQRGHEVRVLTGSYRRQELSEPEPDVDRTLKLRPSWMSPSRGRETALGRHRLDVDRHNFRAFSMVVAAFEPDIVMIFNAAHLGPAILWAAESHRNVSYYLCDAWLAPMLLDRHEGERYRLQRHLYRSALAAVTVSRRPISSDRCIFCSHALLDQYRRLGATVKDGAVIYLALSTREFALRSQRILTKTDHRRIVYAGRLSAEKGVTTLIKAMHRLRAVSRLSATRLSLLGAFHDAGYEAELQGVISDLGLRSALDFLDHRPISALPGLLGEHDAMAFPSEWQEPFGLTLLQGMSVGLPVVATLRGGPGEIVRDGRNAIAFSAGNPDDLTDKLAWVLTHPEEAAAIGRAASEEVRTRFSLESQVQAVEAHLMAHTRRR